MSREAEDAEQFRQIHHAALGLLARREHSRKELFAKLSARFSAPPSIIESVLQRVQDDDYQNDSRFAEIYVSSRVRKGFGPERIERELMDKGVDKTEIEQAISAYHQKWPELAKQAWQKKFGVLPDSTREKVKQGNFLRYRGFRHDHLIYLDEPGS